MVDKDVIFQKVDQILNCLKRIQDTTKGNADFLDDLDVQDIFVLNVQRAVQTCIDLAAHVVSDEGLGLPGDLKDNFVLLQKAKIIDAALSKRLQMMVGFRNIAVHEYSKIDVDILKSILGRDLNDIKKFYKKILQHFGLSKK